MESRVSNDQVEMLLDHLVNHPALAKGVGLSARSKETSGNQWNELATNLNALGSGTTKSGLQWKRYWIDLKHKAKSKAAMLRKAQIETGGESSQHKPLSGIFKKVLYVIGEEAACGDVQFRVPVFDDGQKSEETSTRRQLFPPPQTDVIEVSNEAGLSPTSQPRVNLEMPSPSSRGRTRIIVDSPQTQPRTSQRRRSDFRTRTDNSWVVDLERRRIAAEENLSRAITIIAEASKTNAKAALIQAEAAQIQAKALADLVQLIKK